MSNRAWVTLATNDSYGIGALVLAHSLRRAGSAYPSVVLITPSVTDAMRESLSAVFGEVVTVDVLDSRDAAHLALLQRPELGITFTKIHCWNLTQYEKCVFLDADILVVQNCDELFEREELSAAPDVGWPDCFNSGVFVFKPSTETFNRLIEFARERGSFDGGDQGLLNSFFSDWAHGDINKHLPFLYNVTSAAFYSYLPALKHYGQDLKIIHFIGAAKPWLQHFNWESFSVDAPEHLREYLQSWWDVFVAQVHPQLHTSMVEVEETPPVPPPEQPPHDINPHYHYRPVSDPESEFPWHHPDARIQERVTEEQIDFSDIHDPWEIYKGHIPPKSHDTSTCQTIFGRNEEQEQIRQYAWEYQSQNDYPKSNKQIINFNQQPQQSDYYKDCHPHDSYDHPSYQQYTDHQTHQHHISQSYQSHNEYQHVPENHKSSHHSQTLIYHEHHASQSHDQHHESKIFQQQNYQHYHDPQNYEQNESCNYDKYSEPESCHQEHYEEQRLQDNYHSEQHCQHVNHLNQVHGQFEHFIDNNNLGSYHCDYQNFNDHNEHESQSYSKPSSSTTTCYHNTENNNTYESCDIRHDSNEIHFHHDTHRHENHYQAIHNLKHYSQNNDQVPNQIQQISISQTNHNNEYFDKINGNQTVKTSQASEFDMQNKRKKRLPRRSRINRIDIGTSTPQINGDLSDTDSDDSEILPRHPYDGFYLRHMAIIDPYGRKVCTHEIPKPHQSPSLPFEELKYVNCEGEGALPSSDSDNQTGVAGNLARVVVGASGPQHEAIDELTRRQGWEAGNIDYMGADSFANIWAKISQTLSQPRTSPEKSPPKEPAPPQPTPVEVQPDTNTETTAEPVEIGKEATETPVLIEATTPVKAPAQEVLSEAAEPSLPVEPPVPAEAVVPVQAAAPVEEATSVEGPVSVENIKPVDIATPVETPASVTTVESVVETLIPSEALLLSEVAVEQKPVSEAAKEPEIIPVSDIPVTVDASATTVLTTTEFAQTEEITLTDVPVTLKAAEKSQDIPTAEDLVPTPVEKSEGGALVESVPKEAVQKSEEAAIVIQIPVSVETVTEVPVPVEAVEEAKPVPVTDSTKGPEMVPPLQICPAYLPAEAEAPLPALSSTPPKVTKESASDSPPLAHTPSKEEASSAPVPTLVPANDAKTEERRKPVGKLQLSPPAAPDPLPTPDSEAEDAASLAHSIITSELQAAATAPKPATPLDRLTVDEPQVPTPPVGAVSLAQIGVKPVKGKSTIAAQIESSVAEKDVGAVVTPATPETPTTETPKEAPKEAPKKKIVKKVVKKDSGASGTGAGGEAPVPPPRKKEKKPKEK